MIFIRLSALGLTNTGFALKHAFDLLNVNRMSTGIDTYGMGRCPFYFEPAVLITITDGGKLFYQGRVQERLILPQEPQLPGGAEVLELCDERTKVNIFVRDGI